MPATVIVHFTLQWWDVVSKKLLARRLGVVGEKIDSLYSCSFLDRPQQAGEGKLARNCKVEALFLDFGEPASAGCK